MKEPRNTLDGNQAVVQAEAQSKDRLTKYGFWWGPMEVMRACADGRYRTVLIRTHYGEVQVSVSPTGRSIRVHQQKRRPDNGNG